MLCQLMRLEWYRCVLHEALNALNIKGVFNKSVNQGQLFGVFCLGVLVFVNVKWIIVIGSFN